MDNWTWDKVVRIDDARPAGRPDECFYCRSDMGAIHKDECVIISMRRLEAAPIGIWQPIETYRDGDYATFWMPNGERGNGGMEMGMAFRDDDGLIRSAWTHGGANSGLDFDFHEPPTMWCRNPNHPLT